MQKQTTTVVKLTSRQQRVLWATTRHYIATAEPVGSKALVQEYRFRASPATIRNTMGMLEKVGLLYQPHISAGRVPSDSGYRLYVDQLLQPSATCSRKIEQLLQASLQGRDWSLEALLRGAAQLLSGFSGYVTLVTLPNSHTTHLRHLQLVRVDSKRVMLILVTDACRTQSTVITLPPPIDGNPLDEECLDRELGILSNFLNHHLRGRPLAQLDPLDWQELSQEFQHYADALLGSLTDLIHRCQTPTSSQILISGVAEVLRQPEFAEVDQVQMIVQLLEEQQEQLWPLMLTTAQAPGTHATFNKRVAVWIGSENPLESMRTCALVTATYGRGDVPLGSVGMIGPTRMVYEDAIAMVEVAADYLSETLSQG